MNPTEKRQPGRPKHPVERDTLVGIARDAFARAGYTGTSMDVIATHAGLRKSSLFHHFLSKENLYKEVVLGIIGELDTLILGVAALEGASFEDRLDRLNEMLVDYLEAHPWAALLLLRECLDEHLFATKEGHVSVQRALLRLAAFLEQGMRAKAFVRDDARHLAISLTSLHLTYFAAAGLVSRYMGREVYAPDAVADRKSVVCAQGRRLCGVKASGRTP